MRGLWWVDQEGDRFIVRDPKGESWLSLFDAYDDALAFAEWKVRGFFMCGENTAGLSMARLGGCGDPILNAQHDLYPLRRLHGAIPPSLHPQALRAALMTRAIAVLLLLALTTPAFAEPLVLAPGEPAPGAGVLLPEADAVKAAELLREAATLRDEVKLLRDAIAAKDRQTEALDRALWESKVVEKVLVRELALKDQVIGLRKELNDDYRQLLEQARATIAQDQALLTKLTDRIESLERRAFWQAILGPIAFAAGLFVGFPR